MSWTQPLWIYLHTRVCLSLHRIKADNIRIRYKGIYLGMLWAIHGTYSSLLILFHLCFITNKYDSIRIIIIDFNHFLRYNLLFKQAQISEANSSNSKQGTNQQLTTFHLICTWQMPLPLSIRYYVNCTMPMSIRPWQDAPITIIQHLVDKTKRHKMK